jgi:hypothetical protein
MKKKKKMGKCEENIFSIQYVIWFYKQFSTSTMLISSMEPKESDEGTDKKYTH